jgi:hypothetical protein
VFNLFHTDFGLEAKDKDGFPVLWADNAVTMTAFNQDHGSEDTNILDKIDILNAELAKLGLPKMANYTCSAARNARNSNLKDVSGNALNQGDYIGTILKTPTVAQPCK